MCAERGAGLTAKHGAAPGLAAQCGAVAAQRDGPLLSIAQLDSSQLEDSRLGSVQRNSSTLDAGQRDSFLDTAAQLEGSQRSAAQLGDLLPRQLDSSQLSTALGVLWRLRRSCHPCWSHPIRRQRFVSLYRLSVCFIRNFRWTHLLGHGAQPLWSSAAGLTDPGFGLRKETTFMTTLLSIYGGVCGPGLSAPQRDLREASLSALTLALARASPVYRQRLCLLEMV